MTWEQAVDWLKLQPQHTALTKACFYDDPLIEAAQRYSVSTEWQAVRHLLKGLSGKALDIGAGRGISSYALAKDGWSVTALEPDPSASVGAGAVRQLAVEADISINVVQEWGEKLPFASGEFDLVYCRAVLHHADDLNALCIEAARVLREGGMMIATREHVLTNHGELQRFLRAHPLHDLYGGEHAYLLPEYIGEDGSSVNLEFDFSERDTLFREAAEIIVTAQQGSASLLQRKLKLGYNRAGRLIDQLEAAGIVGQFEGSKARSVNIPDLASLDQFFTNEQNNA